MQPEFWHERWNTNDIRFHEGAPSPLLLRYLPALTLSPGARIFVPLCGKTLDIHYLLEQGFTVAGVELSRLAVEQLFAELGRSPQVSPAGALERYEADGVVVYAGDIFALDAQTLGAVSAVYDRASLVALPPGMRDRYVPHLATITAGSPQLLASFEYADGLMSAPPHSVDEAEVRRRYEGRYSVEQLARYELPMGLKGKRPVFESVYRLTVFPER